MRAATAAALNRAALRVNIVVFLHLSCSLKPLTILLLIAAAKFALEQARTDSPAAA
jgi:hypothetical protein